MQGAGFMVQGSGCRVQSAGFRVHGAGCRVQGSGFRVQSASSGFRGSDRGGVALHGVRRDGGEPEEVIDHLPLQEGRC